MTSRRLSIAIIVIASLLLGTAAQAAIRDGLAFSLNCGGVVSRGGTLVLDRDNTGADREVFVMRATDGAGNVIFAPDSSSFLVGARVTLPTGTFFPWLRPPASNPLTLTIVSPAGNNLAEQLVYTTTFNCPTLTGAALIVPESGAAGPSVPLNGVPPRPTNPPGVAAGQAGYLVVNTDNLFVRTGDSIEYTVVAIVDGGTELLVLGRNPKATWWFVQVGELTGWVSNAHVLVRGDLTPIPVVPVEGQLMPQTLFVYTDNPLYELPSSGSAILCTILGGLEYEIVDQTAKATFYQVKAACNGLTLVGWIAADRGAVRTARSLP